MTFVFNDGGRAAAGYKGKTGDCVCRAIAIVTGKPYQEVYDAINVAASGERRGKRKRGVSSARTGVHKKTIRRYLESIGFNWTPTMQIGSGCKVHLCADELPAGRLIVTTSRHLTAVIDGVVHDTYDPSRSGSRCVYGYFSREEPAPELNEAHAIAAPSEVDLNFIAEQLAELRAERRQDRQRFDSVERVLSAMPDQVALRLSVMFSSRLDRIEDKLRDLEDSR